jgi:hypothetical protein
MVAVDRHQKLRWLDVGRDLKPLTVLYWLVFRLREVGHLPKPSLLYFLIGLIGLKGLMGVNRIMLAGDLRVRRCIMVLRFGFDECS